MEYRNIKELFFSILAVTLLGGCKGNSNGYDASGVFEATEIVVSAESTGTIIRFDAEEGSLVAQNQEVVQIEVVDLNLQKAQLEASIEALGDKQNEAGPQITILEQQLLTADANIDMLNTQLEVLLKEQHRTDRLIASKAATPQQKDEIDGNVSVMEKQIEAAKSNKEVIASQIRSARRSVAIQNRAITSERKPLEKQKERIDEQLNKATVISPVNGTLLTKYAFTGELVTVGKPLFRIADLSEMELRAYISGNQFSNVKLGQNVKVYIDEDTDNYRTYDGTVTWISNKAEFTPKSIQTKDERANLVYAMKVRVKNDGYIKIGMYGEVKFDITDE